MTWYFAAILGAIIWGVHYPLIDKALQHLSIISVLVITTIPMLILGLFFREQLTEDYYIFLGLETIDKVFIISIMFTSIAASALVYFAIGSKNASLASLIEISYPLFVILFSTWILKENHLNTSVLIGGFLIFLGVGIIAINNH